MSDFGLNDITFNVNCHLGNAITFDDTVLGYDLEQANSQELEDYVLNSKNKDMLPECVIVKKMKPKKVKNRKRKWNLKRLEARQVEEAKDSAIEG